VLQSAEARQILNQKARARGGGRVVEVTAPPGILNAIDDRLFGLHLTKKIGPCCRV
jgi:hypothetical protein